MRTSYLPAATLLDQGDFRRMMAWSAAAHLLLVLVLLLAPKPSGEFLDPGPVFVDIIQSTAALAPAKPAPQVVDEPVVIPKKPKPVPKPKPEAKAKPEPVKPKPPPPSAEQLLAKIRQKVGASADTTASGAKGDSAAQAGGRGRFDPALVAYHRQVKALLYSNWVGVRSFQGQEIGLSVFEVEVEADGDVSQVLPRQSSGNRYLDESAERAIWKTDPFPRPPRGAITLMVEFDPREAF